MLLISLQEWHDPLVQKTAALLNGQEMLEDNMDLVELLQRTDCLSPQTLAAAIMYLCDGDEMVEALENKDKFPLQAREMLEVIGEAAMEGEGEFFKSSLDAPLMVFLADKIAAMEDEDPADFDGDDAPDSDDDDEFANPDAEDDDTLSEEFNGEAAAEKPAAEPAEPLTEEELEAIRAERLAEAYKYLCQDIRDACISLSLTNRLAQLPPTLAEVFTDALNNLIERMPDPDHKQELAMSLRFVHKAMTTDLSPQIVRRAAKTGFSPS